MNHKLLWVLCPALLLCLCCAQCKKNKPEKPKTELDKLPPATQTGANTFGCLLNGVAWIPKDNYGQASFKLDVDPTFQEYGTFSISAIKYYSNGKFQSISIGSDSCKSFGTYRLPNSHNRVGFADLDKSLVLISTDVETNCNGLLNITRYDLQNRIFSGTFEFTIYNTQGDTVKITNGRFDKKL